MWWEMYVDTSIKIIFLLIIILYSKIGRYRKWVIHKLTLAVVIV
jgi:hypothetical protein